VVVLLAIMLVARPLAVLVCLPRGWSLPERGLIAWVGLRGAAPILLATFPMVAGIEQANTVFNVVFFVVLLSVLAQGTTIPHLARRLGVDAPLGPPQPVAVEAVHEEHADLELIELQLGETSPAASRRVVELDLPENALIVLLTRGDDRAIPQGSTRLQAGDELVLLAAPADAAELRRSMCG
jgi:potassium/hydrogen antiporter